MVCAPAVSFALCSTGHVVGFSADVCLKFSTAGTYNFICQNHGFKGTIVVN